MWSSNFKALRRMHVLFVHSIEISISQTRKMILESSGRIRETSDFSAYAFGLFAAAIPLAQMILEKKNTSFAKVTIVSDSEQTKKLNFGFSSRIMIFLNGQLLYSGQDAFLTRDYRFLGTMGYFDDVYLSLNKGENEIWMAISEDLTFRGGWGFQAKIEDQKGIRIYQDE